MPTPLPTLAELGGCIFTRPTNKHGYGAMYYKGKQRKAHRVAWEKVNGPIPEGMYLDHICHNVAIANGMCLGQAGCIHRSCVNPNHLAVVDATENQLSGLQGLRNRTHCKNGHNLTEVGIVTRKRSDGKMGERCGACYKINGQTSSRNYRAKKKEMVS